MEKIQLRSTLQEEIVKNEKEKKGRSSVAMGARDSIFYQVVLGIGVAQHM